mmetsp:Transcript_14836/g.32895  ORF Transcript_14836/g.32895 Transcript_14836/m.32895 type:complete len:363 (+) Transcript_14836:610-1698(+)
MSQTRPGDLLRHRGNGRRQGTPREHRLRTVQTHQHLAVSVRQQVSHRGSERAADRRRGVRVHRHGRKRLSLRHRAGIQSGGAPQVQRGLAQEARPGGTVRPAFRPAAVGETTQLREESGRAGHPDVHRGRTTTQRAGHRHGGVRGLQERADAVRSLRPEAAPDRDQDGGRQLRRGERVQSGHRSVGGYARERQTYEGKENVAGVHGRNFQRYRKILFRRRRYPQSSGTRSRGRSHHLGKSRNQPLRPKKHILGRTAHQPYQQRTGGQRLHVQRPRDGSGAGGGGEGTPGGLDGQQLQKLWVHAALYHRPQRGGDPVHQGVRRYRRRAALEGGLCGAQQLRQQRYPKFRRGIGIRRRKRRVRV